MNLICGINPVLEALGAGTRHFDRLLVVKGLRNRRISEAISRAGHLGIPLRFEARDTLDRMAGGVPHQGLIAVVSAKPVITVEKLLEEARTPAVVVVLDGVEDPRNLGAILRTVEAAGADGVLLPDRHSAGLSETVARASAGGLEHVRVATIGNVVQSLEALKARGFWVIGFDAGGTERWDAVDYRRPVALVLGGEGRGIRRLVREHCDHLVSIPLFGHVNSLNVSVAAAIALYEVVRQRGAVPSHVRPIPIRSAGGPRIVGPGAEDAETDPGRVARAQPLPDEEEDSDDTPAERIGLEEDDDHPAWSGPTVLKAVGPRREHGGRGRHGHSRGHGRGGHRPGPGAGPASVPSHRGGSRQGQAPPPIHDPASGEERGDTRGGNAAPPPGSRGPRRHRRRRGNGRRPETTGSPRPDAPPRPDGSPSAEGQGPDAPPAGDGPQGSTSSPPDRPPGGFAGRHRRRRRRR